MPVAVPSKRGASRDSAGPAAVARCKHERFPAIRRGPGWGHRVLRRPGRVRSDRHAGTTRAAGRADPGGGHHRRPARGEPGLCGHRRRHAAMRRVPGRGHLDHVSHLRVRTLFLGAAAVDVRGVFVAADVERPTKRAFIGISERVVLLADQTTFHERAPVLLAPLNELTAVGHRRRAARAASRAAGGRGCRAAHRQRAGHDAPALIMQDWGSHPGCGWVAAVMTRRDERRVHRTRRDPQPCMISVLAVRPGRSGTPRSARPSAAPSRWSRRASARAGSTAPRSR